MIICLICLALLITLFKGAFAIDCYVCSSINGNDPLCEDPFDPIALTLDPALPRPAGNGSLIYLHKSCSGARKSRLTAFPATACLKLAGHFVDNGETMVVRACALDGGSLTSDTEIVRQNHCGGFFLNDRYVRGCLEACFTDGCNSSSKSAISKLMLLSSLILGLFRACQ